ncbi:aminotransferase [Mycolicibacterium nivoides]|uniref:Aminotransferase n=1 Tax=Mycolicibacterium nivoides TaxID=2487344 RepID=A0ABW9LMW0_9MYCO
MKIREFEVEIWMNRYEDSCTYNLAETCVKSITTGDLLELSGKRDEIIAEMEATPLTYGPIPGSPRLRGLVAGLYHEQSPDNVTITHGAIGANALVHRSLVGRDDHMISVLPTYQQHYSIPESFGAAVDLLRLKPEDGWLPNMAELRALVTPQTKLIVINNPNNPTGSLMDSMMLSKIAEIADTVGAYVLCDEVYRGINQDGSGWSTSIVDLYGKGISTGSMSKPYRLAGLRLGWIMAPAEVTAEVRLQRDYDTISVGRIDDLFACVALENSETILMGSRDLTRRNLAILDCWVASRDDVDFVKPAAGTVALLRYAAPIGSYDFCTQLLERTGVFVTPGAAFDIEGTFRVGFADNTETLEKGLELLGGYLDTFKAATA